MICAHMGDYNSIKNSMIATHFLVWCDIKAIKQCYVVGIFSITFLSSLIRLATMYAHLAVGIALTCKDFPIKR